MSTHTHCGSSPPGYREFSCHHPSPAKARRSPSNRPLVSLFGSFQSSHPDRQRKCRIASGAIASASTCPHIAFQAPPPHHFPFRPSAFFPRSPAPAAKRHTSRGTSLLINGRKAPRVASLRSSLESQIHSRARFTSQGARTPLSLPESRRPNPSLQLTRFARS